MMAAVISLTNCKQQVVSEPVAPATVRITVSSEGTKTSAYGYSTLWSEGDAINIYHTEEHIPAPSYMNDGMYTLVEGAGTKVGVFEGPAFDLDPTTTYTFYAVYPYREYVLSPTGESSYRYVGNRNSMTQDCSTNNVWAHLCGSECPLYGVAKGVGADELPSFEMTHLSTLLDIWVRNSTEQKFLVKSATLEETQPVAGQFNIDITGAEPVYTPVENQTVNKAVLNVSGNDWLEAGTGDHYYLPVVPFVHNLSETFRIDILVEQENGTMGVFEYLNNELTEAQATFRPGLVKTVQIVVDAIRTVSYDKISHVLEGTVGNQFVVNNALVTYVYDKGFFIEDNTGTILVYLGEAPTVAPGDLVLVSGTTSSYSNMVQFNKPTYELKASGYQVPFEPAAWTATELDAAASSPTFAEVSIDATVSVKETSSSTTITATVEGSTATLSLTPSTNPSVTLAAGKYNLQGYVWGFYRNNVYMYVKSATALPWLDVNPSSVVFGAKPAAPQVVAVASNNSAWTVSSKLPEWLELSEDHEAGTITLTASENTSSDSRNTTVVLTHATDQSVSARVTVTQNGASSGTAQDGDILWQEDFTGYGTTLPATATGEHVFGGDVVNYSVVSGGSTTKLYNENLAGGVAPEILISKSNGNFKVSGIPSGNVTSMTLSLALNNNNLTLTASEGVTVRDDSTFENKVKTWYLDVASGVSSIDLTFTNTKSSNCRADNFKLVAGAPDSPEPPVQKEDQTITFELSGPVEWVIGTDCTLGVEKAGYTVSGAQTTVTYTSSDPETVAVNATSGALTPLKAGAVTITATAAEDDTYKSAKATYSLTIIDPTVETTTVSKTIADLAEANGWANATGYTSFSLDGVITVSTSGNPNCGWYYATNSTWRLYQNQSGNVTITAASGHELVSVKITYLTSNGGTLFNGTSEVKSGDVVPASGSSITLTVGNTGTKTNGQANPTAFEVVYK